MTCHHHNYSSAMPVWFGGATRLIRIRRCDDCGQWMSAGRVNPTDLRLAELCRTAHMHWSAEQTDTIPVVVDSYAEVA